MNFFLNSSLTFRMPRLLYPYSGFNVRGEAEAGCGSDAGFSDVNILVANSWNAPKPSEGYFIES